MTEQSDMNGEWCEFRQVNRLNACGLRRYHKDDDLEFFEFSEHRYGISLGAKAHVTRCYPFYILNLLTREIEEYQSDLNDLSGWERIHWLNDSEFCMIEYLPSQLKQFVFSIDHSSKFVTTRHIYEYPANRLDGRFLAMKGEFYYKGIRYVPMIARSHPRVRFICYLIPTDPRANNRILTINIHLKDDFLITEHGCCGSIMYSEARQGIFFQLPARGDNIYRDYLNRFAFFNLKEIDFLESDVVDVNLTAENLMVLTLQKNFEENTYTGFEEARLRDFFIIAHDKLGNLTDLFLLDFAALRIHKVENMDTKTGRHFYDTNATDVNTIFGFPVQIKTFASTTSIRPFSFNNGIQSLKNICRKKLLFSPKPLKIDPMFEQFLFE